MRRPLILAAIVAVSAYFLAPTAARAQPSSHAVAGWTIEKYEAGDGVVACVAVNNAAGSAPFSYSTASNGPIEGAGFILDARAGVAAGAELEVSITFVAGGGETTVSRSAAATSLSIAVVTVQTAALKEAFQRATTVRFDYETPRGRFTTGDISLRGSRAAIDAIRPCRPG